MNIDILNDELMLLQLDKVKEKMKSQTASGDAYLNGSLDYLMTTGGKMLRPLLLMIGSKLGKKHLKLEDELLKLATAVETIHLATLIHDDIIDQSQMRRGKESIQAKYGQSYAVYMGDYLLSQCFLMLTHLDLEKDQAISLAKVVTRICVGDMKQNQMRYKVDVSPYQYIKMVSGKTAALISIALSSGAHYAKAKEEHVKLLGRIGYEVGMAFQLIDDLLDYEGDMATVGKEVQVDIARGYYSMPIIYALQAEEGYADTLKSLLRENLSEEDLADIFNIVVESGGLKKTKDLALRYNDRAMALVQQLPKGETKVILESLIPSLLTRIM